MKNNQQTALAFADAPDNDEFSDAEEYLDRDCVYFIGESRLTGPGPFAWEKSPIEEIDGSSLYIHITDHLTHKGISHTSKSKSELQS